MFSYHWTFSKAMRKTILFYVSPTLVGNIHQTEVTFLPSRRASSRWIPQRSSRGGERRSRSHRHTKQILYFWPWERISMSIKFQLTVMHLKPLSLVSTLKVNLILFRWRVLDRMHMLLISTFKFYCAYFYLLIWKSNHRK